MQKTTPKNHKTPYIKIAGIILAIPAGLLILFWLFAFQVPQYSYHYVKCGFKQPVKVVGQGFDSNALNYTIPSDSGYDDSVFGVQGYFCTEAEAEHAGLKSAYKDGWYNTDYTPSSQVRW